MTYPYPPEFEQWDRTRQVAFIVQISRRDDLLAALRGGLERPTGSESRRLSKPELAELLLDLGWHHDLEPGAWRETASELSSQTARDEDDQ